MSMIGPDLALALLVNATSAYYTANAPTYMTYVEHTHVSAPSLGRSQEIDRNVAVRVADNFSIMHDLPAGATRTGQAFPIIPYFDPLSNFDFSYFANLKTIDISIQRKSPLLFPIPAPDPNVSVLLPYSSFWDPSFAPDSTDVMLHFLIAPTPRITGFYPTEIVVDPTSKLPSRIVMRDISSDMEIALDYRILDGHWIITHGVFTATEHAFITFKVIAEVTYDQIAFPTNPPAGLLASPATQ